MKMTEVIKALLKPLNTRIQNMIARAVIRSITDSGSIQLAQIGILPGETRGDVEHFLPYGFAHNPPAGSEALVFFLAGNRDHPIIGCVADRKTRIKNLLPGEVAWYTDEGDFVKFKRGKIIEVVSGTKVKVTAPQVELIGSVKVDGTLEVTGAADFKGTLHADGAIDSGATVADATGSMTAMRGQYNTHVHGGAPDPNPQMV